jgi:hypothetical protein
MNVSEVDKCKSILGFTYTRGRIFIYIFRISFCPNGHQLFNNESNKLQTTDLVLFALHIERKKKKISKIKSSAHWVQYSIVYHLLNSGPHQKGQGHHTERIIQITLGTNSEEELDKIGQMARQEGCIL